MFLLKKQILKDKWTNGTGLKFPIHSCKGQIRLKKRFNRITSVKQPAFSYFAAYNNVEIYTV